MPNTESNDRRRWAALGVLCASLFLTGVDLTALHVAVPAIGRALRPSNTELLWIADAYPLAMAALLLTCGTLADRWGRKRMTLSGYAVFGCASLGAALASDATTLILARVALGAGAAMMMAATVGLIRALFPRPGTRARAMGLWTAANSVGAATGPVLGGLLVQTWWWGAVFLINVPVAVLALLLGARLLPESRVEATRRWDAGSAALAVLGLVAVVLAVKRVAHETGLDAVSGAMGLAGVALLGAFVLRLRRVREPLFDPALFADRFFATATLAVFVCFGSYASLLFFATQLLQFVAGYSAAAAGLALLPLALASAAGATAASALSGRWGHRALLAVAFAAMGLAFLGIAGLLALGPPDAWLLAPVVPAGFAAGAVMAAGADLLTSAAPAGSAATAGAIQETSFELGSGLSIAVLGSVLAVVYRFVLPPGVGGAARESFASALAAPGPAAVRDAAARAFGAAQTVTALVVAAGLFGTAVFCAVRLVPRSAAEPVHTSAALCH